MLRADPKTIFRLRPGKSAHLYYPGDDGSIRNVHAAISSQGLRDQFYGPKFPDEYRILLLGDSFTYGQTVEFPDTIGQQLDQLFLRNRPDRKVVLINMGTPATGPWQQQIFLEDTGFGLQPDLIIHQLFLGNDLHDTLAREGRYLRLFAQEWAGELQRLRMLGTARFRAEQWLADHSRAYLAFREAVERDEVTRFLARRCRFLPRLQFEQIPSTRLIPPTWEVNNETWYPEIVEAFDRIVVTITEIRDACAARGIGYAVYIVPIAEEAVPGWYEEARVRFRLRPTERFDMGKGQRYLEAQLAERAIATVPVAECLRDHPNPERLYLRVDGHTTAAGNVAIAQCLYDYMAREQLPTTKE